MKRVFMSMVLVLVIVSLMFTACGKSTDATDPGTSSSPSSTPSADTGSKDKTVKLTYFNTSAEVNEMFEKMFTRYNELNPNVVIELIPTGIGEGQQEKLQSLFASGNGPTFMNVDPANVIEYQDRLVEFTKDNAPWLFEYANESAIEGGTFGGKV